MAGPNNSYDDISLDELFSESNMDDIFVSQPRDVKHNASKSKTNQARISKKPPKTTGYDVIANFFSTVFSIILAPIGIIWGILAAILPVIIVGAIIIIVLGLLIQFLTGIPVFSLIFSLI